MDEAAAGEGDNVRLTLAPLRQRRRPLPRPAGLVDLLAGENDAAVDDPGRHRRQVAADCREHRLVEDGEPVGHPACPDQHVTLRKAGQREAVRLPEALRHRRGFAGNRSRRLEVTRSLVPERKRHQEIAALDESRPAALRTNAARGRSTRFPARPRLGSSGSSRTRTRTETRAAAPLARGRRRVRARGCSRTRDRGRA